MSRPLRGSTHHSSPGPGTRPPSHPPVPGTTQLEGARSRPQRPPQTTTRNNTPKTTTRNDAPDNKTKRSGTRNPFQGVGAHFRYSCPAPCPGPRKPFRGVGAHSRDSRPAPCPGPSRPRREPRSARSRGPKLGARSRDSLPAPSIGGEQGHLEQGASLNRWGPRR